MNRGELALSLSRAGGRDPAKNKDRDGLDVPGKKTFDRVREGLIPDLGVCRPGNGSGRKFGWERAVRVVIVAGGKESETGMDPMLWHRRETRRPTEKTKRMLEPTARHFTEGREAKPFGAKGHRS